MRILNISNSKKPIGGFKCVKSPSGDILSINILSDFCKFHHLSISCLSSLLSGKRKSHKGWMLETTKTTE